MDLPVDPVHMSVEEILADLQAGHREAAAQGPEAALAFLQRTVQDTLDLPHPVLMLIYDLISEAQAELQDWEGCEETLAKAHEERKRAWAETPKADLILWEDPLPAVPPPAPERPPDLEGVPAPPLPVPLKVVREETPTEPPEPIRVYASPQKFCCRCGKDVTHKARRKDPVTNTYVCRDCFNQPQRGPSVSALRLGRPAIWILLLALLAIGVIVLVKS